MSTIKSLSLEYIALQQLCAEKGYPFDMFSKRVRSRWDSMSARGKRIHIDRATRCCKVVLSAVDPERCPVCGRDMTNKLI